MGDMSISGLLPSALTEEHISNWISNEEQESKRSTRGVNPSAIRAFTRYCVAKGWMVGDPASLVRVNMGVLSHVQKETKVMETINEQEISDSSDDGFTEKQYPRGELDKN
jgi:site-specific recombinase XerD